VPKLLQRLFKSADVRVMLQAYRDEVAAMGKSHPTVLGPTAGVAIVDREVRESIVSNADAVKAAIRKGDRSPRALMLLMVANIASRHAASGMHHTYRAMLSMSGTGLRNLVVYCLTELVALRAFTSDEKREYLAGLDADIKEAG